MTGPQFDPRPGDTAWGADGRGGTRPYTVCARRGDVVDLDRTPWDDDLPRSGGRVVRHGAAVPARRPDRHGQRRMTHVVPWRGRTLDPALPVRVYRCLAPHGGLYSVVQGGRVVGHADDLTLEHVVLHVSAAGHARRLRLGHKVVYAYVQGTRGTGGPCPDRVVLDGDVFRGPDNAPVYHATYARLDGRGLHVG